MTEQELRAAAEASVAAMTQAEVRERAVWYEVERIRSERRKVARRIELAEGAELRRAQRQWRKDHPPKTLEECAADVQRAIRPFVAAMKFTEAFLSTEFATGEGEMVTWGEATVEQHESRITWMVAHIEGCQEDVDLHREVVGILKDAGLSRLADREKVAA